MATVAYKVHVVFKPDKKGIAAVAVGPELRKACHDLVEHKAKPYAVAISPIGDPGDRRGPYTPGDYISSWVVLDTFTVIAAMRRVATQLWNMSPHAAAVEWGNDQVGDGHHVLGETLDFLNGAPDYRHLPLSRVTDRTIR